MRVFPRKITWSFIGHLLKALPASLSLVMCKEVARYLHRYLGSVGVDVGTTVISTVAVVLVFVFVCVGVREIPRE